MSTSTDTPLTPAQRLGRGLRYTVVGPVDITRGDLLADLDAVVDRARSQAPDATLVLFHSAVIAYLDDAGRRQWQQLAHDVVARVRAAGGRAHWVSNEGASVLPDVTATATCAGEGSDFCLGLDGSAVGWTHGHGRRLTVC
mgnify:CR=1 FL=1